MEVNFQEEVNELVKKAKVALNEFLSLDQEKIDYIVAKASVAALDQHGNLAKAAVEETGRGVFEDKATKNLFACEYIVNNMRNQKTVGIIEHDDVEGIDYIADPVGIVCGITPVTNPTSTAIFKSLICLKTRNPIVFSFHPLAQNSSVMAAKVVYEAAVKAGAPKNCIQWIEHSSMDATSALMNHPDVATILATGGNAMVKSAYSCGKPALGVGAGNVPAYIEKTANLRQAINDLVMSKTFDNGMICASEQAVIIDKEIMAEAKELLAEYKVYFCNNKEKEMLEQSMFGVKGYSKDVNNARLDSWIAGKRPVDIAARAGFEVPIDTSLLICECKEVGPNEPLTREKLSPVLALLEAKTTEDGFDKALAMIEFNGLGHSAVIHTSNDELAVKYGEKMKACRILVNQPSSLGGIGNIYNNLIPSLTLGCGSYGHNSISGNIGPANLINIKKVARRRNNMQWFKVPQKIYFERNSIEYLEQMRDVERVFIVTDRSMVDLGYVKRITSVLEKRSNHPQVELFCDVEPDPSIQTVRKGLSMMNAFRPDTIIALGGGSCMDAAKGMWMFYEQPDVDFNDIKQKFMDIRKRAFKFPELGEKAKLVCIPTTSGTGSEVTPFAVITDREENKKYPITDYALTPSVAIVDPALTMTLPAKVTADTGVDVLTHATEAYVSTYASDFTDGLALQAVKIVFNYLPRAYKNGKDDPEAREKMHYASCLAGMAFANSFLGLNHSIAHKIGGEYHVPHGRANAILQPYVIRYNGAKNAKPGVWPKYNYYRADERYCELAKAIGLKFDTIEEGVRAYADACYNLAKGVGIDMSFAAQTDCGEEKWMENLDKIAFLAYEDQCSPANPRTPMIDDIKDILINSYKGTYKTLEEETPKKTVKKK